jgi:hypothetical protein
MTLVLAPAILVAPASVPAKILVAPASPARASSRAVPAKIRLCLALLLLTVPPAAAQDSTLSQRGFVEATGTLYPRTAPTDDTRWVGEAMLRQEASWRPAPWLTLAGAFDARAATDDRVDRSWTVDWKDRNPKRPALGVRSLSAAFRRHGFTLEAGKLFVRWGKADILNPTDRFAPRDFLEVVDNDFLGVTGVRATYEQGADTLDVVWVPLFTPSRMPLPGSRWASGSTVDLPAANTVPIVDLGPIFPSRAQAGFRWNHVGAGVEYSLSYFDGFNNIPRIDYSANPALVRAEVRRIYAPMRMAGADAAWPLRWFTLKGETGYFWTTDSRADDYGIYVIQVERQQGEWLFVGGYAGEYVTRHRTVATVPVYDFDRGLANTFLGRVSYTIDPLRSVAFEGAVRRDASGGWFKAEYSRAAGQHWRATARADLLAGSPDDLFGRYHRNSSLRLTVRYSY